MIRKIQNWLRGEFYTWTWDLTNCIAVGIAERDLIGFHWTLTVYGWAGRRIVIAQGRSFTMVEAQSALCSHMMAHRWMLERSVHAPVGVLPEFNLRRWICDFFKVP